MLEATTSRQINQLIRSLCKQHDESLQAGTSIAKEDVESLASLINAVSVPDPISPASAIGFAISSDQDEGDGE
jgi:hypothetical protein